MRQSTQALGRASAAWLARAAAIALLVSSAGVQARDAIGTSRAGSAAAPAESVVLSREIHLAELPAQAQATHRLILKGGPFPYTKDGSVFSNRERQLPRRTRGYWREYTVITPGSRDRGARRIVCGGVPPTRPEACYYTDDHYANFRRIADSHAGHE